MLQVMRIGTRTHSTRSGTEISDFPECDIGWRLAAVEFGRERILKMPAWRVEERDELVIAARGDPSNADVLKNVKNNIETDYPDTNVQLKHIDNVDEV